ncbi:peptidoglycan bridge formation glycyltransferase FemA/FemB family protein [Streptomyces sp. NPDC048389]|uniref:lipid II:glycine glycyltransferase FemX n=1 Tax=Streptomyces sp. NPDC048389 TaxID=3154622 RepID=UPI003453F798
MSYRLRPISREEHLAFVATRPSASHMQMPSWGHVKPQWRAESLGWFDDQGCIRGAGLVLYRQMPWLKRYLAYLPEGPLIDWYATDLDRWLDPLLAHLKSRGAFSVKMGPPVIMRRWTAEAVKSAIADPHERRLRNVEATSCDQRAFDVCDRLRRMRWRQGHDGDGDGFTKGQPRFVFQLPIVGKTLDEIQHGFNQQWRRNIKKAEKADVQVARGDYEDLPTFHALYLETAERDGFTPRPLPYFQRMWTALSAEHPDRVRLYLAHHHGDVLSAATMLTVGKHTWYSYGASTSRKRELQPSNALQWRMMSDAHQLGADVYDMRGITDMLDESSHQLGLLRFKVGTGGQVAEYIGEWDYPLNGVLHGAFDRYMKRR